jgi:hypothetical protein
VLDTSTTAPSDKGLTHPPIPPLFTLLGGPIIEVEFISGEDAIEISLIESCGAVSGSVFVPIDRVPDLVEQLRRAVPK